MDQLNHYLEKLIATSSFELRLEPNANPYVVSAAGNTEIGNVPLQGSQISMMVFPLIPHDVKQELPNRSSVQFVYPSNMGEFNFSVLKSAAGFKVTVTPVLGTAPAPTEASTAENFAPPKAEPQVETFSPAEPDPATAAEPEPYFPPIDLQPISETAPAAEVSFDSTFTELTTGSAASNLPEFNVEVENMQERLFETTVPTFGEMSPEDFATGSIYVPPEDQVANLPAYDVIKDPVGDRQYVERPASNAVMMDRMENLFRGMSTAGASDLHLSVGIPPMIRKDGKMQKMECDEAVLTGETMKALLHSIMPERNKEEFADRRDSDFAYEIPGLARFRCNIFMDRKGMGGVFRIIPAKMTTAEQLGLSKAIIGLTELSKGLVVVTGPTGSGKSTTLCAMVNHINQNREDHIITIEDPVEFVHENVNCLVNQREVHNHTMSFKDALRAALREDPDIILVGEMRDLETISIAIETAETGHLVFGTLHTTTAVSTVDRIIDQFPADRQQQVRVMLSESLKGVVAQTLLPKKGGGRVAALEVLIVTPAISNLIREGKTFQIASAMQTGRNLGMVMLNDALFDLVQKGIVEPRDAYLKAVEKTGFEAMLTKEGFKI